MDNLLTSTQINELLDDFNKTNDWSVFDNVPVVQFVEVMYPHVIQFDTDKLLYKQQMNTLFGRLGK